MSERSRRLNAIWRDVARQFPAWSAPFDMFFNPSTWQLIGSNLIPSVVRNDRARRAAVFLDGVGAEDLDALTEMSRVNAHRTGDLFRSIAVAYITVPIAIAALISDAAPDLVSQTLRTNLGDVTYWVSIAALTPIVYFCGMWRAKQIQWTLELYKIGAIEPMPPKVAASARAKA